MTYLATITKCSRYVQLLLCDFAIIITYRLLILTLLLAAPSMSWWTNSTQHTTSKIDGEGGLLLSDRWSDLYRLQVHSRKWGGDRRRIYCHGPIQGSMKVICETNNLYYKHVIASSASLTWKCPQPNQLHWQLFKVNATGTTVSLAVISLVCIFVVLSRVTIQVP